VNLPNVTHAAPISCNIVFECRKEIMHSLEETDFAIYMLYIMYIGSLVCVLPEQILKVLWKPSEDAGRSAIKYIVNTTTTGMDYMNSTFFMHPITSIPISGLPQYSAGTVSVWAKNPGATSKPVNLRFMMVNIVTNGKYTYIKTYGKQS